MKDYIRSEPLGISYQEMLRVETQVNKNTKDICIEVYKSKELFHDRYIFLDYKEDGEEMYHSGSSSKDAGNKITTILKEEYPELYHPLLDRVLRTVK